MKVFVNIHSSNNTVVSTSINIDNIENLKNEYYHNIIDNTIMIGDKCFVPLKYGSKCGFYLGKSAKGNYCFIEINWGQVSTGFSINYPQRADFYLSENNYLLEVDFNSQLKDYIQAFNNNEKSFTFNLRKTADVE